MSWLSLLSATSGAEQISVGSWALAWHLETHHGMPRLWECGERGFFQGATHFSAWLGVPLSWRSPCETTIREIREVSVLLSHNR